MVCCDHAPARRRSGSSLRVHGKKTWQCGMIRRKLIRLNSVLTAKTMAGKSILCMWRWAVAVTSRNHSTTCAKCWASQSREKELKFCEEKTAQQCSHAILSPIPEGVGEMSSGRHIKMAVLRRANGHCSCLFINEH